MKAEICFFVVSATLSAQWLNHPTPGIPRAADGSPNLSAPAPRTTDGKPDLSGIWQRRAPDRPLTADLKPGEIQPWAEALVEQRREDLGKDRPSGLCLPSGPAYITFNASGARVKIIQTPGLIVMLHEDLTYRQIFMDGREHPKDPDPTWYGHSVGRKEEDTLIVDTVGFNDKFWFDFVGHPHTEQLHTVERYRRTDLGTLVEEVTIYDPGAYTRPFTIAGSHRLLLNDELMEYVCQENERDLKHLSGPATRP